MKQDAVYLQHIKASIEEVYAFTREGKAHFLTNRMVYQATLRSL